MAEGEPDNGQVNGSDAAAKKAAEANGTTPIPLKETTSVSMDDGSEVSLTKGTRKRECLFIGLAICLGIGLIAVLVYFSVANALQQEKLEAVKQTGNEMMAETTTVFTMTTTESLTTKDPGFQGTGGSLLGRGILPEASTEPSTTTTTEAKPDFSSIDKGSMLRGGRLPPPGK